MKRLLAVLLVAGSTFLGACGDTNITNVIAPPNPASVDSTKSQFYVAQTMWPEMYGFAGSVATNAFVVCGPRGIQIHAEPISQRFPIWSVATGFFPDGQTVCPGTAWQISIDVSMPDYIFTDKLYMHYKLDSGQEIFQEIQIHVQSPGKG